MEKIIIDYTDLEKDVVEKYLIGNIFHVTPSKNFDSIMNDGRIYAPNPERYTPNFPQSYNCYGFKENCVCMLDFRNIKKDTEIYKTALEQIYYKDYIFILKKEEHSKIIPPKSIEEYRKISEDKYFIPLYECWYKEEVSLNLIAKIINIRFEEYTGPPRSFAELACRVQKEQNKSI